MAFEISKEFHFSAAHSIPSLPDGHACKNLHGHNYKVVLHLSSDKLDEHGFVKDFKALDFVKEYIDNKLDHKNLNDVFTFTTSSERIAMHLYEVFKPSLPELFAVTVSETDKTRAVYHE